ncbi:MAG: thioredoxin family protein [Desulfococcaceae bacterium]
MKKASKTKNRTKTNAAANADGQRKWIRTALVGIGILLLLAAGGTAAQFLATSDAPETAADPSASPVAEGKRVTMIDLGAKKCIPCKLMAPILEKLEKAYAGRADIVFIDVWEKPEQAKKYGIRAIPTQIFFVADGKEVYRHTGFMDENTIVAKLSEMGVKKP